ncbi:S1C family serine protease [Robertmurraya korlensis]|uniref:S1C family serine protease n=1 Tax=Robertmurraya korlensis TaxID=519977 RepID=UPI000824218E|nr:trypsin-like peptidase domain-containing protein [Robertmurraya korlensis]
MGYYDQDYETRYRKQKGNRGGYFLASLVGAILGVFLIIVALPRIGFNVLPYSTETDSSVEDNTGPVRTENVSLNVVTDITKAVEKAGDAVVGITNLQTTSFWSESSSQEAGSGSGVIYKKADGKAYVVTNHHVIEGANSLEVTLTDGTKLEAKLRGSDVWTDLAVLEVDGSKIETVAEFGDSDALKIGEPVIAIGNPLGATFSGSVTQGIVSGLERAIPVDINQDGAIDWQAEVLQTDAAINPGNSGGALINISGQVIGINSMKIAQSSVEGIGLSIPIKSAEPIISDLEEFGEVKRPYMGIQLQSVNEVSAYHQKETLKLPEDVTSGVVIMTVDPNSPAEQAGLEDLDVIVEMDGDPINDVIDLRKHLYNKKKVGDQLKIKFYRAGKIQETTIKLGGNTL